MVANTHILFNPKRGDIKLQQVKMTLSKLWEVSGGGAKRVLCFGDAQDITVYLNPKP